MTNDDNCQIWSKFYEGKAGVCYHGIFRLQYSNMNKQKVNSVLFAAVLLLAASWKICLLLMDVFPFNSDEAIVGLMAKHILAGEHPFLFYGQAYMGSLDAWLVAAGFAVFGSHIWVIRLIQIFLYIITIAITMSVVKNISGNPWAGLITGLLLAIPPVNTTLYTTISLGGYGEALLIGSLLLLVYTKYLKKEKSKFAGWTYVSCAGFLTGIGFWVKT